MGTLRHLRAIVWLRWRILKNSVGGSRKRDTLEQMSRTLALVVPFSVAALSLSTFIAISVIGFLGGRAVGSGLLDVPTGVFILRIALAVIAFVVIALAMAAPTQSATAHYTRLLLLPIHRRVLHLVEVAAHLADPWLAVIGAGLAAFSVGLFAADRPGAAFFGLAATAGSIAVLVSAGSLTAFLVAWLMKSRRRGELFTLIFVMGISLLSFLPAFASRSLDDDKQAERSGPRVRRQFSVEQFDRGLPRWTAYLPSELHGSVVAAALQRKPGIVASRTMLLFIQAAILFLISSRVHGWMLGSLEGDGGRRRSQSIRDSSVKLPFLSPAASAVAWAQFKGALRTVRGRLTILLPGPLLGIMTVAFQGIPNETWATNAAEQGYLLLAVSIIFTLYSMHAVSMNFFGSDRAGLTMQLLAPLTDRELAWGKVAGFGLIIGLGLAICLVTSLAVARSGPASYWIATILGAGATFFLLCPIAVWLSALFPVASDLSKTGSGGNPHPLPMILGTVFTALFALPAAILVVIAEFGFQNELMAIPLMAAWLAVAMAIGIPLVNLAARSIGMRRENLAMVAQGR